MDIDDVDFVVLPELTEEEAARLDQERHVQLTRFYALSAPYCLGNWYNELKQFTAQSYCFPLTADDALVLRNTYYEEPINQEARQSLASKVDTFIADHFPGGCFFKLSSRSPKDVLWKSSSFSAEEKATVLAQHIRHIHPQLKLVAQNEERELTCQIINSVYLFILEHSRKVLLIENGQQFIRVFGESDRVTIDLSQLAELKRKSLKEGGNYTLIEVWGRKWMDLQWSEEFRCFYQDCTLKGVSQYAQWCYFKQIQSLSILPRVQEYFTALLPKLRSLNLKDGVLDLHMTEEKLCLLQINVFDECTRASLFNWEQLRQPMPLTLRIRSHPQHIPKTHLCSMMGMIEKGLEEVLDRTFELLSLSKQWKKWE